MISLIPAIAGRTLDVTMSQQTSQMTQMKIDKLIKKTHEKDEEHKKKKKKEQACEKAMKSSKRCQQEQGKDPITTVIKRKAGCTLMIECIAEIPGNESARREKADDELRERPETDVATWEELEFEQEPQ